MIRLTLHTGPMKSGKTIALADTFRASVARGHRTALLRPRVDTRDTRTIGFARPVYLIHPHDDPFGRDTATLLATTDVILIDEVQFIAIWVAEFLDALKKESRLDTIQIVAAGLDLKADGTPWPGMDTLSLRAGAHIRHTGTCEYCGAKATMTVSNAWMPPGGIRIGDDRYHTACHACWQKHAHTFHNRMKESA